VSRGRALGVVALALLAGCSHSPPPGPVTPELPPHAEGAAAEGANTTAALSVVATAREALGKPYLYGGTGQGTDGFDCSGLIQYSYGQHGIMLPRTSSEQALIGDPIDRDVADLAAGDILTFASSPGGTRVSHVGLYLGEGRFIHSASSRGVMESALAGTDPNGNWWFVRWIGARRVIGSSP
jgi:cell wall-associated NlpC family hydrolase